MKTAILLLTLAALAGAAHAKLPALSDEAKAKAAEAAAKAAHGNKVADYQLCQSMDRVAQSYYTNAKKTGLETKPPVQTAACVSPPPFVYTPPAAAGPAAAPTGAPAAPPASAMAAPVAKK